MARSTLYFEREHGNNQRFSRVMTRPAGRVRRQEDFKKSRVGSGRVGSRSFEISHVGSGRAGSGRVERFQHLAGRVGSDRVKRYGNLAGRVGL